METMGQRITRLLTAKNGNNQSELARFVRVSPQAVQQWATDYTSPRGKNLAKVAEFLGCSQSALKFGNENIAVASLGGRSVPLISSVQAGMWTEICNEYAPGDGSDFLTTALDLSEHAFALEIKGDSMLPDFRPGDCVIIDPEVTPNPGDFVVAKNGKTEATFKKYRPRGVNAKGEEIFELVPLNEDYPTLRSETTEITIIGTMVEFRRYRKP